MFSAVLPGVASVVQAYPYTQTLAMLRDATAMPGAGLFDQRVVVRAVLFNAGLVVGSGLDNQSLVVSAVLHDECFVPMAALGAKGLKRVADLFDIAPLAASRLADARGVSPVEPVATGVARGWAWLDANPLAARSCRPRVRQRGGRGWLALPGAAARAIGRQSIARSSFIPGGIAVGHPVLNRELANPSNG